jgi:hypothetical protein
MSDTIHNDSVHDFTSAHATHLDPPQPPDIARTPPQ